MMINKRPEEGDHRGGDIRGDQSARPHRQTQHRSQGEQGAGQHLQVGG